MTEQHNGFAILTHGGAGEPLAHDTVGAVVRGADVHFAVAGSIYGYLEEGMPLQQALQRGIDLIAVSKIEAASCSNTHMSSARIVH